MSRERSASAITSLPKPGALAPAGVGRSSPATAGSASLARAVAVGGGVMAAFLGFRLWADWPHPTGSAGNSQAGSRNSLRTSLRALSQPGEQSYAGIAVSRRPAHLALIILHGERRCAADAAVGEAGVEAECGEAALNL